MATSNDTINQLLTRARILAKRSARFNALQERGIDVHPDRWDNLDDQRTELINLFAALEPLNGND